MASALIGPLIVVRLDAGAREFVVEEQGGDGRRLPLTGVVQRLLSCADYVTFMGAAARAERFRYGEGRQLRLRWAYARRRAHDVGTLWRCCWRETGHPSLRSPPV